MSAIELQGAKVDALKASGWEHFRLFAEGCDGWLIAAKLCNPSWMEFVAYEMTGLTGSGFDGPGLALFLEDGWSNSGEVTDEPTKAEVFAEGVVKWDGDTQMELPNGICASGKRGARMLGRFFAELQKLADEMMPDSAPWRDEKPPHAPQ